MTATLLLTLTMLCSLLILSVGVLVAAVLGNIPGGVLVALLGTVMAGATAALIIDEFGPRRRTHALDRLYVRAPAPGVEHAVVDRPVGPRRSASRRHPAGAAASAKSNDARCSRAHTV